MDHPLILCWLNAKSFSIVTLIIYSNTAVSSPENQNLDFMQYERVLGTDYVNCCQLLPYPCSTDQPDFHQDHHGLWQQNLVIFKGRVNNPFPIPAQSL